ncbi:MAG: tetratricopeptide repeat protein [bacterium]
MLRVRDLKTAIWVSIISLALLSPSLSLAQVPQEAETHNRLGNEYCDNGEFQKAVKEYEEAVRIYPQYVDAYYNLGVTYYSDLKDYQKAANYLQKFLEFEGNTPDAQQIKGWLATIEQEHGIKPQQLAVEKKAEPPAVVVTPPAPPAEPPPAVVVTPPPLPAAPPVAVPVPEKPAPPEKAAQEPDEESYKKAIAHKNRGNLYSREGKHQMAVREYQKALDLRPNYTDALYNLGKTYDFELNDNEKAIMYYEGFLKYEQPNSADAREVQTWLTKAKMDVAEAKKAPAPSPEPPVVVQKPLPPKGKAEYEAMPFTKGVLEKPIEVASVPKEPVAPPTVAPPAPVVIPAPEPAPPSLAPPEDSTILRAYIPGDMKSVQSSILVRSEMRNELLAIFRSKDTQEPEKLAQLFLTKVHQEELSDGAESTAIKVPGVLLANSDKIHILTHADRIRLNSEKGNLLRSPQTPETRSRLQEINKVLEDGFELRP